MSNTANAPEISVAASGLQPLRAKSGWIVALGVIYVIAGFVALGSVILATVATVLKEGAPWIWVALSGAITLLPGIVILAHWPVSGLYILGLFLGIDLVLAGASWIAVGFGLRARA